MSYVDTYEQLICIENTMIVHIFINDTTNQGIYVYFPNTANYK